MNRFLILISLLLSLFYFSCENDKVDPKDETDLNEETDTIIFYEITKTTETGAIISDDTTDWKFDDEWSETENSLFPTNIKNNCNSDNYNYSIIAYPNPCEDLFRLDISKPNEDRFSFRIVDRDYNILMSNDSIYSSSILIKTTDLEISDDTVRMYYKLIAQDCESKGHGDIKIE